MAKEALFVCLLMACAWSSHGVMFELRPNAQKCLKEDIQADQLVMGEYEVTDVPGQTIDYIARDTKGHILSQKENITKGKFSFMSEVYDTYEICFKSKVPKNQRGMPQEVSLNVKKGVETNTYEGIGEDSNLQPLELDLKRLEDLSEAIVRDFLLMRKREEEKRSTNESTTNFVLFFSIFGMCSLFALATWQVLYLRRYFKAKKVIE